MASEKLIIVDVETAGSVGYPLVYDIGWIVCDRQGRIFTRHSFVVEEIFNGEFDKMRSAYYSEKIPSYIADLSHNSRTLAKFRDIAKVFYKDIDMFDIKKIGAYNMTFDRKALNNTVKFLTGDNSKNFFRDNLDYFCIWHMACQVLMSNRNFFKKADENGWVTEKGNYKTSAEVCYRYITDNINFGEDHTGLEDVLIEYDIFLRCVHKHRPMDWSVNSSCWSLPTKKAKAMNHKIVVPEVAVVS